MITTKSSASRYLSLLAFLALAATSRAQAPIEPEQLPARTVFYVVWRGVPAPTQRQSNSLLALWDDPDFAPVRFALVEQILSNNEKSEKTADRAFPKNGSAKAPTAGPGGAVEKKTKLTRQELEEFASLLDNGFVLGYFGEPEGRPRPVASAAKPAKQWNGIFLVYDRSGKEALLAKTILRAQQNAKEPPQLTALLIAGVPVAEIKQKDDTSYIAQTGKFAVFAQEKLVLEDILKRVLQKSPPAADTTLASNPVFREAQSSLGSHGILDFFLRMPDLSGLTEKSPAPGVRWQPTLDAIRLDAIHSLCGTIILDGPRSRIQGALLGDTSRGTLFDLFTSGEISPAIAALASAETIYFNQSHFDPLVILETVRRVARALSPPGQTAMIEMFESSLQTRLGMPLADAFGLFTGEFASIQSAPDFDPARQIYALGIRRRPEVLKLLRTVLNERLSSERAEGDITFLKISLSGNQGGSGIAQWNFYHLAVTPDLIAGASRSEALRAALAQRTQSGAAGLLKAPKFLETRGHFPPQLNGIAYADFQRVNWQAVKDHWIAETKKSLAARKPGSSSEPSPKLIPGWLEQLNPEVFSRHLHTSTSASWKDSRGLHFDGWMD